MKRNTLANIDSNNSISQDSAEIDAANNSPVSENSGTLVSNDERSMEHSRSERPLVMRNFGYKDRDAFLAYMGQMLNATSTSRGEELDALSLKFLIGFVEDFGPQNQIEAAAAMQMATLHQHAMGFAHRASMADNALERELNERHFIKCSRTYMDFMAATKIFRNTSQPGVTVQNFVKDGQAIVDVSTITNNGHYAGPSTTDAELAPRPRVKKRKPMRVRRARLDKDD
jgi:hypothetical protein